MKEKVKIAEDSDGNKVVLIPEIIFKNRQNIDWNAVEKYLQKYIGDIITIAATEDVVYVGTDFPDEYKGSKYTRQLKGSNAKAKANAVQGIKAIVENAVNKKFQKNKRGKHFYNAGKGWYYYTTRFALPIYKNEERTKNYNIYSACLLVKHSENGRMYLYDLVDIKREASNPLRTTK